MTKMSECDHVWIVDKGIRMCTLCYEIDDNNDSMFDIESYVGSTHTSYGDNGFIVNTSRAKSTTYGKSLKLFCKQSYNSRLITQVRDTIAKIAANEGFSMDIVACATNYFDQIFDSKKSKRYDTVQLQAACFYYACKQAGLIIGSVNYRSIASMFGITVHKLTQGLHIFREYIEPPDDPIISEEDMLQSIYNNCKDQLPDFNFCLRVVKDVFQGNILLKSTPHRSVWAVVAYTCIACGLPLPNIPYSRPMILNAVRRLSYYNEWLLRDK